VAPQAGATSPDRILLNRDNLVLARQLDFAMHSGIGPAAPIFTQLGMALALQGLGTALILAVVALIRDRDQQTAAAGSAEVLALQSRMNPHGGKGAPSTRSEQIFFAERLSDYALTLLRRRLRGLYGRSFKLEVLSEMGGGLR